VKKLFSIAVVLCLIAGALVGCEINFTKRLQSFEPEARAASGAIFVGQDRKFICSGTEIGRTPNGDGVFLTARHCAADPDTNKIREQFVISFSDNQGGPFYDAKPIAISLSDDLALLLVRNGADVPEVQIRDERPLRSGDPVFNVSFPLGGGKLEFHGEFMASRFPFYPPVGFEEYPMWVNAMPVNCSWAHGSSGSGLFSMKERGLIGVVVAGSGESSYNAAIPADRVIDFLNDLQDNTVDKFVKAFPEKDPTIEFF
jgi:S1-C subfamily serine protease